ADFSQLSHYARRKLRSMQRRPTLATAFWNRRNCPCNHSTIYARLNRCQSAGADMDDIHWTHRNRGTT
ncbi:MAG TPA: hypothetical protein VNJ47_10960, partial [Nevskiales bacterium]|nr:hypothetical protein [Nevskiales bacterium]